MRRFWAWLNRPDMRIRSLQASLDDANATITRLAAEKAERDVTIRAAMETLEAVYRPKPPRPVNPEDDGA